MNTEESMSMFGTLLGTAVGWYFGGPLGGAIGGSVAGELFGAPAKRRAQQEEQKKLTEAQVAQNKILHEKFKRDSAELYSSVSSSINQTSGAMGAVY